MIEIAEEKYGIKIKKKHSTSLSNISGNTDKKTSSV